MKLSLFFILLFSGVLCFGQQKQICFSFDDLPVVKYGIDDSTYQQNLFNNIVSSLKAHRVPAIGFVNEKKLRNREKVIKYQVDLLQRWASSGLDLGNHSYSHFDYNQVSFGEYASDILKGETTVKAILARNGKSLKYFRHPFLHVGNTKAKADSLDDFLRKHHYMVAPVTIDNDDYLFAQAYHRTKQKGDTALMHHIGNDYIAYMGEKLNYYEMQANRLFGRTISQILLLHTSLLNSDYLDALIALCKKNHYAFVSMDEALNDPAYKTEVSVFGNGGLSWIDKWALSAGNKGEFFKDDPATPDYIKKLGE